MSEQHGFHFSIVEVFQGADEEEAFQAALAWAREVTENTAAHVVVTPTGFEYLGEADGVFCEGCEGHVFPGVRWPTRANDDGSHEWVERCDTCKVFDSDEAARDWLVETYGPDTIEADFVVGAAVPAGSSSLQPFLDSRGSPARGGVEEVA